MAIVNATDIVVKLNTDDSGSATDKVLHCTSASLSLTRDMRDSTTKDSEGWSESLAGLKSWEISGDGFVDFSGTNNTQDLITEMFSATPKVKVLFGNGTDDYSGVALITSFSVDAGVEENATYSLTLQGTGALSLAE